MAKVIKLTRPSAKGANTKGDAIYILVDTILFFEERFVEGKFQGTYIFFSSTVGQDYAPVIVVEAADDIFKLINSIT